MTRHDSNQDLHGMSFIHVHQQSTSNEAQALAITNHWIKERIGFHHVKKSGLSETIFFLKVRNVWESSSQVFAYVIFKRGGLREKIRIKIWARNVSVFNHTGVHFPPGRKLQPYLVTYNARNPFINERFNIRIGCEIKPHPVISDVSPRIFAFKNNINRDFFFPNRRIAFTRTFRVWGRLVITCQKTRKYPTKSCLVFV
eukprot:Lithocolla_globosa_v1_NODE_2971_length_1809_cov_2.440137.p2 type:complete len:199 gc:universal NODE_2971_length_1809_cov_2.440137:141-737(+)